MHQVRLLLASALLMVGCAADDAPAGGSAATAVTSAPSADAAAPAADPASELAAEDAVAAYVMTLRSG